MFGHVSSFMCVLRGILEALPHYDSTYLLLIVLVYFYSFIYKHDTLFVSLKPEYQRFSIFLLLSLAAPACAPYTLQQPYYFLIQLIILISFMLRMTDIIGVEWNINNNNSSDYVIARQPLTTCMIVVDDVSDCAWHRQHSSLLSLSVKYFS